MGLKCGVPIASPALTINRLCGSGFETVIQGAKSIKLNEAKIVVCGGAENMSMAPLQVDGNDARWGVSLGSGLKMRDSLWDGLTDQHAGTPMGITAENLAVKYGISREVSDISCCVDFAGNDAILIILFLQINNLKRTVTSWPFGVNTLGVRQKRMESLIWRWPMSKLQQRKEPRCVLVIALSFRGRAGLMRI